MEENAVSKTCTPATFNVNSFLNSTTIHILIEIIVVCGMGAFFNHKINKQAAIIKELSQRIAEQDESIARQQDLLEKIVDRLNGTPSKTAQVAQPTRVTQPSRVEKPVVHMEQPAQQDMPMGGIPFNLISDIMSVAVGGVQTQQKPVVPETLPTIEELDNELEAELGDLKAENDN
jgi:uncharacterized coiled-coil protein SlyX